MPESIFIPLLSQYLPESWIASCSDKDTFGSVNWELITCATLFWVFVLYTVKIFIGPLILSVLFGYNPESAMWIPRKGYKDSAGNTEDFEIPLLKATPDELGEFLRLRGFSAEKLDMSLDSLTKAAAQEALKYRGELFDCKLFSYLDENFTKNNKGTPYPVPMKNWGPCFGWFGFWKQLGPSTQAFFLGNFAYSVQHFTSGLFAWIALTRWAGSSSLSDFDAWFLFKLAIYLDVGFNLADLILMLISVICKIDISFYSGLRFKPVAKGRKDMAAVSGVMTLLVMHHAGAA
eukprot:g281.t1